MFRPAPFKTLQKKIFLQTFFSAWVTFSIPGSFFNMWIVMCHRHLPLCLICLSPCEYCHCWHQAIPMLYQGILLLQHEDSRAWLQKKTKRQLIQKKKPTKFGFTEEVITCLKSNSEASKNENAWPFKIKYKKRCIKYLKILLSSLLNV